MLTGDTRGMIDKCNSCLQKLGAPSKYVPVIGESCTKCILSGSAIWNDSNHSRREKRIALA
jgi:hypothetical protein